MMIVRSNIESNRKIFKSMEIKKLDCKKELDPQGRIEK